MRSYKYDNIRFLLILTVVFAHLVSTLPGENLNWWYRLIYSFHMPAFIFLSGYFAKMNGRKWAANLLYPYVLFQIFYLMFDAWFLLPVKPLVIQFTEPYYILWYLMALMIYFLLIPVMDAFRGIGRLFVFGVSILVSLTCGFDQEIGLFMSLSRCLSFLPFFVAGYYWGHRERKQPISPDTKFTLAWLGAGAVAIAGTWITSDHTITRTMMFEKTNFISGHYGPGVKALIFLAAACWILFLLNVMPDRRIPVISACGARTLYIFVGHAFIVLWLRQIEFFSFTEAVNGWLALGISLLIILILGNKYVYEILSWVFTGKWVAAIIAVAYRNKVD